MRTVVIAQGFAPTEYELRRNPMEWGRFRRLALAGNFGTGYSRPRFTDEASPTLGIGEVAFHEKDGLVAIQAARYDSL